MQIIQGVIRNYDWGHRTALAEILGHEVPGEPEAEYWLGAHPGAPAMLPGDPACQSPGRTLDQVIAEDPSSTVGDDAAARFGGLPFLLKILAAERPLSIQAHPSREQARAGFAREDAAAIDRGARNRNYRDDNHKPELICALTPFEAKCGFRPVAESLELLRVLHDAGASQRLEDFGARLAADGDAEQVLSDVVAWLLRFEPVAATELVAAVRNAAARAAERPGVHRDALRWAVRMADAFPSDPGVAVALLLNHLTLEPGQAVFLEAGNLHSYLRGVGVELMANSDNVLRGGLTTKHVDVAELLKVVDCRPDRAPIQTATEPVHRFDSPVPEFSLTRYDSTTRPFADQELEPTGPDIVLVTAGSMRLTSASGSIDLAAGESAFVGRGDGRYRLTDRDPGRTVAWRAGVGVEVEV